MKKSIVERDMKVVVKNSEFGKTKSKSSNIGELKRLCRGDEICVQNMYPFIFNWDIDYNDKLKELKLNLPYIDFEDLYKNVQDPEIRESIMEKRIIKECINDINIIGEEIIDYDCNSLSMSTFDNNMKEFIFETHRKYFPITEDREEKLNNIANEINKYTIEDYIKFSNPPLIPTSVPKFMKKKAERTIKDTTIDIVPLTDKVSKSRLEMKKKCIEQDNAIYTKIPVKFSSYENKFAGVITCHPNEMNNIEVNFKDNDIIEIKDIIHKTADDVFNAVCDGYKQAARELSKNNKDRLDLLNACLYSMGITPGIVDTNKLIKIDMLHRRNNPMDDSRKIITYLIEYDLENCYLNNIF